MYNVQCTMYNVTMYNVTLNIHPTPVLNCNTTALKSNATKGSSAVHSSQLWTDVYIFFSF